MVVSVDKKRTKKKKKIKALTWHSPEGVSKASFLAIPSIPFTKRFFLVGSDSVVLFLKPARVEGV
jgi:hypothetical protein